MSLQNRFANLEKEILKTREEYKKLYLDNDYVYDNEYVPITFDTFQAGTAWTAQYPTEFMPDSVYLALGLAGESGELCENCKKLYRDDNGNLTDERRDKILKEAGDVIFYLSALMLSVGIKMSDVAKYNQNKLLQRLKNGKIKGDGNDR